MKLNNQPLMSEIGFVHLKHNLNLYFRYIWSYEYVKILNNFRDTSQILIESWTLWDQLLWKKYIYSIFLLKMGAVQLFSFAFSWERLFLWSLCISAILVFWSIYHKSLGFIILKELKWTAFPWQHLHVCCWNTQPLLLPIILVIFADQGLWTASKGPQIVIIIVIIIIKQAHFQ